MSDSDEPRIIVDDDWKSQIEHEKEQLRARSESGEKEESGFEMPAASMATLVSTLATQAIASLGAIADPVEGKPVIRKSLAKHFIDTLAVLEEKTAGNLSEEETAMLGETLHQLRMLYVQTPATAPASGTTPPRDKPAGGSTIELP